MVSLWQDRDYAQLLKPVRFPPLLTDTCRGRWAYVMLSLFQFAPGFLSSGPFHISQVSFLCLCSASPSTMFIPNSTAIPGSLSSPLALPTLLKIHIHRRHHCTSPITPSLSWRLCALLPAGRTSRQPSQDTAGWNGRSSNQECHRFSFFSLQVQRHYTFQSFMQLAFGQSPEYWNGCFRKAM